jgi:hypothetical protein
MSEKEKKEFRASHRTGLMSVEARVCPNPPGLCLPIQNLAVAERQSVLRLCLEDDTVHSNDRTSNRPEGSHDGGSDLNLT